MRRFMKASHGWLLVFMIFVITAWLPLKCWSCNEALCASVVSKCMLTQSCKCELKNCICCKDCFNCLDYLYAECCSCVEMCPKANNSDNQLNHKSHVEDLLEPMQELFMVLTEAPDSLQRWTSFTYPAHKGVSFFKDIKFSTAATYKEDHGMFVEEDFTDINCTVAYMSQCMSWKKCKSSCRSMGAASYRWFHDGCCECVGKHCVNYGINESRCIECPTEKGDFAVLHEYDEFGIEDEFTGDGGDFAKEDSTVVKDVKQELTI